MLAQIDAVNYSYSINQKDGASLFKAKRQPSKIKVFRQLFLHSAVLPDTCESRLTIDD